MQSGSWRDSYGNPKGHETPIRGVATDTLNQVTISGGSDAKIKFWKFKNKGMCKCLCKHKIKMLFNLNFNVSNSRDQSANSLNPRRTNKLLPISSRKLHVSSRLGRLQCKYRRHRNATPGPKIPRSHRSTHRCDFQPRFPLASHCFHGLFHKNLGRSIRATGRSVRNRCRLYLPRHVTYRRSLSHGSR